MRHLTFVDVHGRREGGKEVRRVRGGEGGREGREGGWKKGTKEGKKEGWKEEREERRKEARKEGRRKELNSRVFPTSSHEICFNHRLPISFAQAEVWKISSCDFFLSHLLFNTSGTPEAPPVKIHP